MHTDKDRIRVVAVVGCHRIEGDMHVLAGSRLTDSLNSKAKDFVVVTEATVYDGSTGAALYSPEYLVINRESISIVFPKP